MKEISVLEVTDNKKLVLSIGKFRGEERIDLRQYVKVKGENSEDKFIATRKGINFNSEWIDKFIKMIRKLENV